MMGRGSTPHDGGTPPADVGLRSTPVNGLEQGQVGPWTGAITSKDCRLGFVDVDTVTGIPKAAASSLRQS